jgi:hypothetical protein
MALSVPRASLVDLVAKLEVLSKDNGCLLDLSAILDVSICPTLDIFMHKPHHFQPVDDDHICVTPTQKSGPRSYTPSTWCPKNTIDFDLLALVGLDLLVAADLELYLNLLHLIEVEIDLDITLGKRSYAPPAPAVPAKAPSTPSKGAKGVPKTPALLGIDLDLGIDLNLDLSVDLDLDIEIGGRRVRKAQKHFAPQCGKKIPDNTPGCKRITAKDTTDCLARCHQHAAQVTIDAKATVGDLAKVVDCTAISFDHGLQIDNCLVATIDVLGLALIEANVDTLIRL